MASTRLMIALVGGTLACLLCGGAVMAQSRIPRLPRPYTFDQAGDSPGKVTFTHQSHVNERTPSCTACHPKMFSILKAGTTGDGKAITHEAMNKGATCGACHNNKTTFGFDDCTLCHRSQ